MSVTRTRTEDLERAVLATWLLAGTPPDIVRELVAAGTVHRYRRGTYLFHQGDPSADVHFLTAGRVEISSTSVSGHRQLHTTLDPPELFGELGVLGEMPRTATAVAVEDATTLVVQAPDFVRFLERQPAAGRLLFRALARQIAAHEALVDDLLSLDLKGRVAKRLLGLVTPSLDELPEDGAMVPSIVTHADLAALAGGSRENVTRILSDFQRRGLVARDGRRYVLQDVKALARRAGL